MTEVKQMKLLSGEEILCDLVDIQWDDNEGEAMIIRAAYLLVSTEDFENGLRYYTFRPFMMHVNDPSHVLLLNSAAVICMTTPHPNVKEQYINYISQIAKEEREKNKTLDDFLDEMVENDSPKDENVVTFKPKLH